MEQEDTSFDHQAALSVIDETIRSVRQKVSDNGFVFLLWGWLVLLGNVLSYYWMVVKNGPAIGFTWMVIGVGGGIVSGVYYSRKEKKKSFRTQLDRHFGYLWGGIGMGAIILYAYFIISGKFELITPFVLVMCGMATYISGRMLKVTALTVGGFCFWASAIGCLFLDAQWHFLVGGLTFIPGYLVPGYVLRGMYKKSGDA